MKKKVLNVLVGFAALAGSYLLLVKAGNYLLPMTGISRSGDEFVAHYIEAPLVMASAVVVLTFFVWLCCNVGSVLMRD